VRPRDVALALAIVLLWGVNYVVIKLGLIGVSPFVLGGLRMLATALPAVFFLPRPRIPLRVYAGFAGFTFVGQFSLLFWGIKVGMPSGLAAVVQQSQALITVVLAALVFREHPRRSHVIGISVAAAGLVWLATTRGGSFPIAGFLLTVGCAISWALGNLVSRTLGRYGVNALAFVVWSALLASGPFFLLAFIVEGGDAVAGSFRQMTVRSWAAVLYLGLGATFGGFGLWNRLLKAYPAALVTRFALLLPVVALICGRIVFAEEITVAQAAASALVVGGIALPLAAILWGRAFSAPPTG
jgi:O-acetylserine/cysteine efflux transporter